MNKFLALLALTVLPLTVMAHGPSPQKVEKSVVIKAAPAKVWAMVKDFGNMQAWHPAIASTSNFTFHRLCTWPYPTKSRKKRGH